MGNGVSTDQGNLPSHGTRDVRDSDDNEQHDSSQLAEAPNTNSALLVNRGESYRNIRNMRRFAGVPRGGGVKRQCGCRSA